MRRSAMRAAGHAAAASITSSNSPPPLSPIHAPRRAAEVATFASLADASAPAAAPAPKRGKRGKRVKTEEEEDDAGDDTEPRVKKERTKRVKKEVKSEDEGDEDEPMEESKEAPPAAAPVMRVPDRVDPARVRIVKPDGRWVELDDSQTNPASAAAASSSAATAAAAAAPASRTVLYWMTREMRVEDNWCLLYAQQLAHDTNANLRVIFSCAPAYLEAGHRHYTFLFDGLREVEAGLRALDIPFEVLRGYAWTTLPKYIERHSVGAVVTCFGPLRISKEWIANVSRVLAPKDIPFFVVDGHNVVPVWSASEKQEYAARTIRPKITRQLPRFLTEFPRVARGSSGQVKPEPTDWVALDTSLVGIDRRVKPLAEWKAGTQAAFDMLHSFIRTRLHHYATKRNDPNSNMASGLSPYLHFGHIAPQRCALEANKYRGRYNASVSAFIEELVIRRELSDNHCYYNEKYDSIDGASAWARDTLIKHTPDKRSHLYTTGELEFGVTYDQLWNAAQLQMVHEGKMSGFMRMYWAKCILAWTATPQIALETAIYLNDRFSLDGRDPNGFVGCAWSVIGIHDIGFAERPVFGKIRYMSYDGCRRKFNIQQYIDAFAKYGSKVDSKEFKANQVRAKQRDEELKKAALAKGTSTAAVTPAESAAQRNPLAAAFAAAGASSSPVASPAAAAASPASASSHAPPTGVSSATATATTGARAQATKRRRTSRAELAERSGHEVAKDILDDRDDVDDEEGFEEEKESARPRIARK